MYFVVLQYMTTTDTLNNVGTSDFYITFIQLNHLAVTCRTFHNVPRKVRGACRLNRQGVVLLL